MTFLPFFLLWTACDKAAEETGDPVATDSDSAAAPADFDEDGFDATEDCDDSDAAIFPGAEESCNGKDDNCNGVADEGFSDVDADEIPDCQDVEDCDGLDNDGDGGVDEDFADNDGDDLPDCLDSEECDGLDNDGDGDVDEGYDGDGDGYLPCGSEDMDPETLDCDDSDGTISPGSPELDGTLVDEDCDGLIDEGLWAEGDLVITELLVNPQAVSDPNGEWFELLNVSGRTVYLDGLRLVTPTGEGAVGGGLVALEHGGYAVVASSDDTNTNGRVTADIAYGNSVTLANETGGLAVYAGDILLDEVLWDDGVTFPNASGASMSLDPDFLTPADNDLGGLWCDADTTWTAGGDYGTPGVLNTPCASLDRDNDGYSPEDGDCEDDNDSIGPHMDEIEYDGLDNDCDPDTLDDDLDQDGYIAALDCDDNSETVNPGAREICDPADIDEDCNGVAEDDDFGVTGTTTWYLDDDGDTYGDDLVTFDSCNAPAGYVAADGDCDDTDAAYNPGATEDDCEDPNDYNCDGLVGTIDEDGDGFFNCEQDCNDLNASVYPYAFEDITDGIDNDCDGLIDGKDPEAPVSISLSDDSTSLLLFSAFSFPFCGTTYSSVYVSSNGRLTFGFSDTSYSESTSSMGSARSIAGIWDDLNPSTGGGAVYWIEHSDAVGVYYQEVNEYGTGNSNTFAIIIFDDGRIMLTYGGVDVADGLAGWSCGSGSLGTTTVDLTDELALIPEGSAGIGAGTESGVYELFTSGNDLENNAFPFCVNSGTDGDGDGWTDDCGDINDSDASIYP